MVRFDVDRLRQALGYCSFRYCHRGTVITELKHGASVLPP